jgi:hypothetical protein
MANEQNPLIQKSVDDIIQDAWDEVVNKFTEDGKKNVDDLKAHIEDIFAKNKRRMDDLLPNPKEPLPQVQRELMDLERKKKCILEQIEWDRKYYENKSVNALKTALRKVEQT